MAKITINNVDIECNEGDNLLEVSRKNGIQVPSICYLSGCSPTLACRMCMVEIGGKRVYSCNTKVKDGMNVLSNTDEILKDRHDIMQTYCVNHPLECGVCDKSGECELQDFTLMTKVDLQVFGLKESDKKPKSFAQTYYDPNLCIMCERCITTCKDNIGDNNLKVGKVDLFTPDHHKDAMSKDPYSVWSKRQKGLIDFAGRYECKDCGECISVCPVGAMTYKSFTYTSNAWELRKVYSTCAHCSCGCNIVYNVKHADLKGDLDKVYRIQNDYHYNPICGAGRFVFDNVSVGLPDVSGAVEAFKRATVIDIGSEATNEEVYVALHIAKKLGVKVRNYEAMLYSKFKSDFESAFSFFDSAGECESYPYAVFDDFKSPSSFVSVNTFFKYDAPLVRYRINNSLKANKTSRLILFAPFGDLLLTSLGKTVSQFITPPNSSLFALSAVLLANGLLEVFASMCKNALNIFGSLASGLEALKSNMQSALSSVGIDDISSLDLSSNESRIFLISYNTLLEAKDSQFLALILAFICKHLGSKIMYIPKGQNVIGISSLCPYDMYDSGLYPENDGSQYVVSIRNNGDYILDCSYLDHDFPLPSVSQLDGTITNVEHRVLALDPSVGFCDKYLRPASDLLDIGHSFGLSLPYNSDYTSRLCELSDCYECVDYDDLCVKYNNDGSDLRGVPLRSLIRRVDTLPCDVLNFSIPEINSTSFNAIMLDPQFQFTRTTRASSNLQTRVGIYTSKSLLSSLGFADGDRVYFNFSGSDERFETRVYCDYDLDSDLFLVSTLIDSSLSVFKRGVYVTIEIYKLTSLVPEALLTTREELV